MCRQTLVRFASGTSPSLCDTAWTATSPPPYFQPIKLAPCEVRHHAFYWQHCFFSCQCTSMHTQCMRSKQDHSWTVLVQCTYYCYCYIHPSFDVHTQASIISIKIEVHDVILLSGSILNGWFPGDARPTTTSRYFAPRPAPQPRLRHTRLRYPMAPSCGQSWCLWCALPCI